MDFRTLKAEEIEVRVQQVTEKGAIALIYKDARVDMNLLDESKVKWKREHQLINGKLFCTVSLWDDEIKEWVSRQDVGVESNTEATKGEASDSFKRACFNWGIGRELYTSPFIWIPASKIEIRKNGTTPQGKDRFTTYDKLKVAKIKYNETREIVGLAIANAKTNDLVFIYNNAEKNDG